MNKKLIIGIAAGVVVLGAAIAAIVVYFNEIEDFLSNLKYRIDELICRITKKNKCIAEDELVDFADI